MLYYKLASLVAGAALPLVAVAAPHPLPEAAAVAHGGLMYDEGSPAMPAAGKRTKRTNHEAGSSWMKSWSFSSSSEYYPSWSWSKASSSYVATAPTAKPHAGGYSNMTYYANMTGAILANKTSTAGYSKSFPLVAGTEYVLYMNSTDAKDPSYAPSNAKRESLSALFGHERSLTGA